MNKYRIISLEPLQLHN